MGVFHENVSFAAALIAIISLGVGFHELGFSHGLVALFFFVALVAVFVLRVAEIYVHK